MKQLINGILAIFTGMFTILKHAFRPAVTLEYPEKKAGFNSRLRGRVALRTNKDGSDVCIACGSCQKVCPCNDLIKIEKEKDENGKFYPKKFSIDIGRCIFCGNCTEICPVNAIVLTKEYELADYDKANVNYDKQKLSLTYEESEKIIKDIK